MNDLNKWPGEPLEQVKRRVLRRNLLGYLGYYWGAVRLNPWYHLLLALSGAVVGVVIVGVLL